MVPVLRLPAWRVAVELGSRSWEELMAVASPSPGLDNLWVDDHVELVHDVPGRRELKAGRRGRVLVAGDGAPWAMVSMVCDHATQRPWLLHRRHLRHVVGP